MLTKKQEEFAKCIVEGMNGTDAYKKCYNAEKMSDESIYVNASKLIHNDKVALRIQELREQLAKSTILTAQERLEFLTGIVKGAEEHDINARLKAVDIMNKMTGEYVQKIDANVNADVEICVELLDED